MDYLVKIRSVQTPLNGQFSIGANKTSYYLNPDELLQRLPIELVVGGFSLSPQHTRGYMTTWFNAAMKAGIETLPCWVEEMDDDTAYMELVKANNQGELLALEIGIHALATVNDKTKKGGGVRAYAAEIGKGEVSVTEWTKAASVYVFLSRTSETKELNEKTKHLSF